MFATGPDGKLQVLQLGYGRRHSMRRIPLTATVSALLALAGCGGSSSTVSLSSYVRSLCTSVRPVKQELENKLTALAAASLVSPDQSKKAFEDFLSSTASATDATAAKLKRAGTPSGRNGKEISDQFIKAFGAVSLSFKQAAAAAQSIPTSSHAAFRSAERRMEANIQTSLSGLQSSFRALQSPQLTQAVKQQPACAGLSA